MKPVTDNPNTSWYPNFNTKFDVMKAHSPKGLPHFKTIPSDWRQLDIGEIIKAGDILGHSNGRASGGEFAWKLIGKEVTNHIIYRRPVIVYPKVSVSVADLPYPKDAAAYWSCSNIPKSVDISVLSKWRRLGVGETIKAGDVHHNSHCRDYTFFAYGLIGVMANAGCWYRRPELDDAHETKELRIEDLPYPKSATDKEFPDLPKNTKIPSSWRKLENGETIKAGDIYQNRSDGTTFHAHGTIGDTKSFGGLSGIGDFYRRPELDTHTIAADVTAPKTDKPSILKTLPDDVNEIVIGGVRWKKTLTPVWNKE